MLDVLVAEQHRTALEDLREGITRPLSIVVQEHPDREVLVDLASKVLASVDLDAWKWVSAQSHRLRVLVILEHLREQLETDEDEGTPWQRLQAVIDADLQELHGELATACEKVGQLQPTIAELPRDPFTHWPIVVLGRKGEVLREAHRQIDERNRGVPLVPRAADWDDHHPVFADVAEVDPIEHVHGLLAQRRAWAHALVLLTDRLAADHRGVGLIATNAARTRFLVQRKDESYPEFPQGYSLFGGACEPGESDEAALVRELYEELGDATARVLVDAGPREIGTFEVGERRFGFTLFETVVAEEMLDVLASLPVFEGERAEVVPRGELMGLAWVWGLGEVLAAYVERIDG